MPSRGKQVVPDLFLNEDRFKVLIRTIGEPIVYKLARRVTLSSDKVHCLSTPTEYLSATFPTLSYFMPPSSLISLVQVRPSSSISRKPWRRCPKDCTTCWRRICFSTKSRKAVTMASSWVTNGLPSRLSGPKVAESPSMSPCSSLQTSSEAET